MTGWESYWFKEAPTTVKTLLANIPGENASSFCSYNALTEKQLWNYWTYMRLHKLLFEDVTFLFYGKASKAPQPHHNADCRFITRGRCCQSHFDCLKWYPCWGDQPYIGWLDISQGAAANLQSGAVPLFWGEQRRKYPFLIRRVSVSVSLLVTALFLQVLGLFLYSAFNITTVPLSPKHKLFNKTTAGLPHSHSSILSIINATTS